MTPGPRFPQYWVNKTKQHTLEEGTGVTSDVIKVKGEDAVTPGPLQRNDPRTVTIPQYWFNKTKQHTRGGLRQSKSEEFWKASREARS